MTIRRVGTHRRRVMNVEAPRPALVLANYEQTDERTTRDPWAWTLRDLEPSGVGARR